MDKGKTARRRESIRTSLYGSAAAAVGAEAALAVFLMSPAAEKIEAWLGLTGADGRLREGAAKALFCLGLVLGTLVFLLVLSLLRRRQMRYLSQIVNAMRDISEGDFDRTVAVEGDNELSELALMLNRTTEEVRALIAARDEAEQTKNDLITNVAHDLRTPLTSVIGYLDLLRSHPELPEEKKKEYLDIACDKADHLQKLIEELFGFTKLGRGEMRMDLAPLDLSELLGQLLTEFWPVFAQNGIICEYRGKQPLPVAGDGTLLARLFDNLISNAVKYGKEGKKIIVETESADGWARVRVINYGKVIAPEALAHLFDRFYRAETSRNPGTGGTGLGLAIAKNIAEMHGGSIEARSSLQEGTVFEVKLPLRPDEPAGEESAPAMAAEDEAGNRSAENETPHAPEASQADGTEKTQSAGAAPEKPEAQAASEENAPDAAAENQDAEALKVKAAEAAPDRTGR
ncbi:MAG: ATP-binding protein [Lachnospiraceae bacterium]